MRSSPRCCARSAPGPGPARGSDPALGAARASVPGEGGIVVPTGKPAPRGGADAAGAGGARAGQSLHRGLLAAGAAAVLEGLSYEQEGLLSRALERYQTWRGSRPRRRHTSRWRGCTSPCVTMETRRERCGRACTCSPAGAHRDEEAWVARLETEERKLLEARRQERVGGAAQAGHGRAPAGDELRHAAVSRGGRGRWAATGSSARAPSARTPRASRCSRHP